MRRASWGHPGRDWRGPQQAAAGRIGEAYGLGASTTLLRARRSRWPDWAVVLVVWLGAAVVVIGLAVTLAVSFGPYPAATQAATAIGYACSILIVAALAWRAWPKDPEYIFWYSGGLAHLGAGSAEPAVLPWDDVASVSLTFRQPQEVREDVRLLRCVLGDSAGTEIAVDGAYGRSLPAQAARAAQDALTAGKLPQLIRAYDAGQPVVFSGMSIDRTGITLAAENPGGEETVIPWQRMRWIAVRQPEGPGHDGGPAEPPSSIRIDLGRRHGGHGFSLAGRPDTILIPHLLEHVAAGTGLRIRRFGRFGYEPDEPGTGR
jgi:hypothetical protein